LECKKVRADRDFIASINLHNQLGKVLPEVTPVEITALNQKAGLIDLTSIVEAGNKHHHLSNCA